MTKYLKQTNIFFGFCLLVASRLNFQCVQLTLTHIQMGEAARPVWKPSGLDSLLGCLATRHYSDCAGHKLDTRFRVTVAV